ncbi:MAG: hypothetical protein M3348_07615 [Acidobacteriota bacterium]|nr:hypothetical protein [Acidobacteriota bacterium]
MPKVSRPEAGAFAKTWLRVDSFEEMMKNEEEIVERIRRTPNGAQLFLVHPFLLLRDIGVELSERAELETQEHEPRLTGLSARPYEALKRSGAKQNVRFHLHGLFERRGKK